MEGDPLYRSRRRGIWRQVFSQRLGEELPRASVIVAAAGTGPAVAICLAGELRTPLVVASGRDWLALRIRQLAARAGVTVVEDAVLAAKLYKSVRVGSSIPRRMYEAIADAMLRTRNAETRRRGEKARPVSRDR